jgi:hypothetical protein
MSSSTGCLTGGQSQNRGPSRGAPWLVSLAMYSNFMRVVGENGVTIGELKRLARVVKPLLAGLERWGYVVVENSVIRATAAGRRAQEVWRPLFGVIEERWRARFGKDEIGRLRGSLSALVGQFDLEMPDYLPVLGYGLIAQVYRGKGSGAAPPLDLPALISKGLLAFTIEFESESDLSLAIGANVIRLSVKRSARPGSSAPRRGFEGGDEDVDRVPRKARVPGSRAQHKLARLTAKGLVAQAAYWRLPGEIEERWRARFGEKAIRDLRESLEALSVQTLSRGLEPYPDGWRALLPKPRVLSHYPMVLHRGAFPDGA